MCSMLKSLKQKPVYSTSNIEFYQADSRSFLKLLPSGLIQSCITSPPYWGMRDYGISNQIGAESNIEDYISDLVNIFLEVKRVMADDGLLWLNLGDTYTSGNRKWRDVDEKNKGRAMSYRPPTPHGLKSKDLIGLPWRVAFALQASGWYLRSDIIWNKPNCQPESVRDRPTRSHEYLFLFSKSLKYYYNQNAIKILGENGELKNIRTVWNINTVPYKEAHFAVFPPELIKTCMLASTKPNQIVLDPFLGSGTVAQVAYSLDRSLIGIDLNMDYIKLGIKRMTKLINT